MSRKEANRTQASGLLEEDKISRDEAAKMLGLTPRQVRRIVECYRAEGLSGLVSMRRGQLSNRRLVGLPFPAKPFRTDHRRCGLLSFQNGNAPSGGCQPGRNSFTPI
ncbi:MAG: helix-turn-helix domain-containing protein [Sulfuricella sp.]